jgi:polyphenol oxidase
MLDPIQSTLLGRVPGVGHGFFTRGGGVSKGVYASLNCGLGSGDERRNVIENRRRVAAHFDVPGSTLLTCHQIHSATAVIVDRPWLPDAQPRADAVVTRTPGLVLGTLAADCTPVLFADGQAGVIGAAHAGWKGALGGIVEATIVAMEQAGAERRNIVAAIGPCISKYTYEVGPEFEVAFLGVDKDYARFFGRKPQGARPKFDLPGFVADRLTVAQVGRVEEMSTCTYSHPERFFSYRRMTHLGQMDYGRQISALVLT